MSKKTYNLENVVIDEVSIVDEGANQHADVEFFKQKGGLMTDENLTVEDLAKQLNLLREENAFLKHRAEMSEEEKRYMDNLYSEEERRRFAGMSSEERKKAMEGRMEKSEKQDQGLEKRLKYSEDVIAKQAETITKLHDKLELMQLEKRAEQEFSHLSGTSDQKARLLKSLEGIEDEEVRKLAIDTLKSKASENEQFTKEAGTSQGAEVGAYDELAKMAKNYAQQRNVTESQGWAEVLATPEGSKLYQKYKEGV